jgi:NhaP-type Na+/H+ or K+/H+ antiporter
MIKNRRDFYAGLMFMIFGLAFMILSQQYSMGTASKMGPAYFPTILGGILAFLGLIVLIGSVRENAEKFTVQPFQMDIILYILGAVGLFAAALGPFKLGFIVALLALILVSSRASHEFSWRDTSISIVVLSIASYLIFILGLQLQLPVLPKFFG